MRHVPCTWGRTWRLTAATLQRDERGQLEDAAPRRPTAMAQPPAFNNPYAQQNKGTLVAGQTISVNKYTVQVERYLSQGMSSSRCRSQ